MEQTIELMRKRHAYYTKLIAEHNIHTAREFYVELHELFAMFGVDVYLNESETECTIGITCEDYDYEDYTVVDGKDGGLATIKVTVEWKHPTYMCNDEVDIFADANRENSVYVTTGFADIDAMIGGWKKSSVSMIAGRPNMGKSTLSYNMALNISSQGIPVALFSLCESATQVTGRMLSNMSLTPYDLFKNENIKERQWAKLNWGANKLKNMPIYIEDTPSRSPSMLHHKIGRLKLEHGIKIVFIDYFQLMNADEKKNSREEEIASILSELNIIAQRCQIPIVVVKMLNRMTNADETYRPDLSEFLKSERAIPSTICYLYRPNYYDRNLKGKKEEIVDFTVAKSPEEKTGTVQLKFYPDFFRFESIGNE